MKALVSAYACEPYKGSEGGVGWNWVKQIAKVAETWVITRANNRRVIDEELYKNPITNLHFEYVDLPNYLRFWKRKEKGLYVYYFIWQILAFIKAYRLNSRNGFDAVHHLTFGNFWLPTFMTFIPTKFIWGPLGGGEIVPRAFRKDYTFRQRCYEALRDLMIKLMKFNPLYMFNCRKASIIVLRTKETASKFPAIFQKKIKIISETALNVEECKLFITTQHKRENTKIVLLSVGRLIHLKGFDLAIKAVALLKDKLSNLEYHIIGDGEDRKRLEIIIKDTKLEGSVKFLGRLPRNEVLEHISSSSIFLMPSLKEGGAWVLFEAMALSKPIVCLDIAGPSEIVDNKSGIKVKPINPEQTISALTNALLKLTYNSNLRIEMGEAGKKRVEDLYSWNKKGTAIAKIYARINSI